MASTTITSTTVANATANNRTKLNDALSKIQKHIKDQKEAHDKRSKEASERAQITRDHMIELNKIAKSKGYVHIKFYLKLTFLISYFIIKTVNANAD